MAKGRFASTGVVVGQTPASQWGQRLQNQKGAKVTMGVGVPRQSDGAVGDITVREISNVGLRAYIKTNGGWVDINTMQSADRTQWTDMNLVNSWVEKSDFGKPQYFRDTDGFVHFRGGCDGASNYLNAITTLPEGFRPVNDIYRHTSRNGSTSVQIITVQDSGIVSISAQRVLAVSASLVWNNAEGEVETDTTAEAYLDGISFFTGQKIRGSGGGSSSGGEGGVGSGSGGGA